MQYNDGDRIMQVKQFTPLYLTASAVMLQDSPMRNGSVPRNHSQPLQANGYLPGGANGLRQPLNSHSSNNSLLQSQHGHSRSNSSLYNGGSGVRHLDSNDLSVIASKSSGSITKFITSTTSVPLSRKPSSADMEPVFSISGNDRPSSTGVDLNSTTNCTASEGTTAEDIELAEVMARHETGFYAVENGKGGRVYACHYV